MNLLPGEEILARIPVHGVSLDSTGVECPDFEIGIGIGRITFSLPTSVIMGDLSEDTKLMHEELHNTLAKITFTAEQADLMITAIKTAQKTLAKKGQ